MDKFILHSVRECPFSISVRVVLEIKQCAYDVVEERPGDWTDFLCNNLAFPQVPALIHGDKVISESNPINEYLDGVVALPSLIPDQPQDEDAMRVWWRWCEGLLKPALDQYYYLEDTSFHLAGKVKVEKLFNVLESELRKYTNLVNQDLSLADIAVIPFIRKAMLQPYDPVDMGRYPRLKKWADQVLEAAYFNEQVMRKYPLAKGRMVKRF